MNSNRKKKKVFTSAVAVTCAAAVAMTGTFAWQAIANATNDFSGKKTFNPGSGTLHDDFDGRTGKQIYVENTSASTPIYVRVKLSEYMDLSMTQKPATPIEASKYTTHIPAKNADGSVHYAVDCNFPDKAGIGQKFHDHFKWTMGGGSTKETSIKDTPEWKSIDTDTNLTAEEKAIAKDKLIADQAGSAAVTKPTTTVSTAGMAQNLTIPQSEVIALEEYQGKNETEKASFRGWIYDTDGYAYWSQALGAGTATGYLLNGVQTPADADYYYSINATMEYVDATDIKAWTGVGADGERTYNLNAFGQMDATTDTNNQGDTITEGPQQNTTTIEASKGMKEILNTITGTKVPLQSILASGPDTMKIGTEGQISFTTNPTNATLDTAKTTYESSDNSIVTVDSNGKVTALKKGVAVITVTAYDKNGNIRTSKKTITVADTTVPVQSVTAVMPDSMTVGDPSERIDVTTNPENATLDHSKTTYTSSNPEVATVDQDGNITPVKAGTTTITVSVTDQDGNTKTTQKTITINPEASKELEVVNNTSRNVTNKRWIQMWEANNGEDPTELGYQYVLNDGSEDQYKLVPKGNQQYVGAGGEGITQSFAKVPFSWYVGEAADLSDYTFTIKTNDPWGDVIINNETQQIWGSHLWSLDDAVANYKGCNTTATITITQKSTGATKDVEFYYELSAMF